VIRLHKCIETSPETLRSISAVMQAIAQAALDFARTPFYIDSKMWTVILVSFLSCQLLYRITHWISMRYFEGYRSLTFLDKIEWQTRVASTVHGLIVFPICFYTILVDNELSQNPVWGNSNPIRMCLPIGAGYFASDSVIVMTYQIPPVIPIMLHHVFAGYGFLLVISDFGHAIWFATLLLCTEATAPWNNFHWKLTKSKLEHSLAAKIIGFLFATTWFVFRILLNPYLYWKMWYHWQDLLQLPLYLRITLFVNVGFLSLLNNYWFIKGPFKDLARLRVPRELVEAEKLLSEAVNTAAHGGSIIGGRKSSGRARTPSHGQSGSSMKKQT